MKLINKIILFLMLASSLVFANSVGRITALKGSADIVRDGLSIKAILGAKLNEKDNILTKDKSKVQIVFNDETIITVGKNSNFSINEYLFEESTLPKAKFELLSGAMRAITGKIGKIAPDKFSVKTKNATIGIRGTNFSVLAGTDGGLKVYCTFGAISTEIKGDISIVTQGFYIVVSPAGEKSVPLKFTPKELNKMRNDSFIDDDMDKKELHGVKKMALGINENTSMIDTTKSENMPAFKNMARTTTDGIQMQNKDKVMDSKNNSQDMTTRVEAEAEAAKLAAEGQNGTNAMTGYSVVDNSASGIIMQKVNLNIESPSLTANSYIITFDSWFVIFVAPIIDSYVSTEDFSGSLNFAISQSPGLSALTVTESSIIATPDDLKSDDGMSWGLWNATVDYTGGINHETFNGLWVSGESLTPVNKIEEYRNNKQSASYSGKYKAITSGSTEIINGSANLDVNFGNDSATLVVENIATFDMSINGNTLTSSSANGVFYGTDGKSVGGNFQNGNTAGVYQATTLSITAPQ